MTLGEMDHNFTETEGKCIDNCVLKMFKSERILRSIVPFRLGSGNFTQELIEKRLNNPTDSYG